MNPSVNLELKEEKEILYGLYDEAKETDRLARRFLSLLVEWDKKGIVGSNDPLGFLTKASITRWSKKYGEKYREMH
jgi:hypothetical protein